MYSELEAWAIFIGALIIGIVLTSLFWAFITIPEDVKKIEQEIENATELIEPKEPNDFISFCDKVDGISSWDNNGFRQCILEEYSDKNLVVMNLLCKKFNLSLSYGSYGVKCEGRT